MSQQRTVPLYTLAIRYEQDIVTARQKSRDLSKALGFDSQDQVRIATAVSELARNVFQYAKQGLIEYSFSLNAPQSLHIKVTDKGPGILDLQNILNGLYVSATGMGVGLLGTKKLADTFDIKSSYEGTQILFSKNLSRGARVLTATDLNKSTDSLLSKQAGTPFEEIQNQNRELMAALEEVNIAREELSQLNNELAETNRGVVALYAELDEKAESLQNLNEVKTSFLSNMTHEFRTPLSSIISLTRLLLSHVDGELNTEQQIQVNYIQKSSEGLLELVNDLLDLAKVEAGKVSVNVNDFHIEEVLGSLRGMFRPIIGNNSQVDFEVNLIGSGFEMVSDQAKIAQVLRNFISNAIKFTDQGSIKVTAQLIGEDRVQFKVKDTGIGIEENNLDFIFEDFSQVDSYLQKKQKGTGLGLSLSKKLTTLLSGEVDVESEIGQGSVFTLTVPRVYGGASEAVLIPNADQIKINSKDEIFYNESSEKFRVLLVDDDEPSRYILKNLISRELNAVFKEAVNGEEGLKIIKSWNPDVVFLDLSMPQKTGYEVLEELNKLSGIPVPVIVNTSAKLSNEELGYLKTKVTAVISKERSDDLKATTELQQALVEAGFNYLGR